MILTCSKSWEASSCIAYNQKHEQINNKIKATNDYINIVNPEGGLLLLISSLEETVALCFSLDHHKYARWLSIFIRDLKMLKEDDPNLFKELGSIFLYSL